ncbi:hypothetical protein OAG76_05635, partial [Rubripirellula sp.]|nr:hypothetical protein [Rubripirellula sp.]
MVLSKNSPGRSNTEIAVTTIAFTTRRTITLRLREKSAADFPNRLTIRLCSGATQILARINASLRVQI